jgi:nitrate reductase NapE component
MVKIKIVVLGSDTFCPENGGNRFPQNVGNYIQNEIYIYKSESGWLGLFACLFVCLFACCSCYVVGAFSFRSVLGMLLGNDI